MMCKFPGCIAQAVDDEHCGVHAHPVFGKPCERCKGSGSYWYKGQGITMACQMCGGTGLVDHRKGAPRRRKHEDPIDQRGLIKLARS